MLIKLHKSNPYVGKNSDFMKYIYQSYSDLNVLVLFAVSPKMKKHEISCLKSNNQMSGEAAGSGSEVEVNDIPQLCSLERLKNVSMCFCKPRQAL